MPFPAVLLAPRATTCACTAADRKPLSATAPSKAIRFRPTASPLLFAARRERVAVGLYRVDQQVEQCPRLLVGKIEDHSPDVPFTIPSPNPGQVQPPPDGGGVRRRQLPESVGRLPLGPGRRKLSPGLATAKNKNV